MKSEHFNVLILVCGCLSYGFQPSASLPVAEDESFDHPHPQPQHVNVFLGNGNNGNGQHGNGNSNGNNGLHLGNGNGVGNGRPTRYSSSDWKWLIERAVQRQLPNRNPATTMLAPPESEQTISSWEDWLSVWRRQSQEVCGIPGTEPFLKDLRVAGGTDASLGNWPWMVSISNKVFRQHWCGGILISDEWVLTAAHCLFSVPPPLWDESTWIIRLGKEKASMDVEETEQDFGVCKLMVHPNFNPSMVLSRQAVAPPSDHDLALLKLDRKATFTQWVRPACLPEQNSQPAPRERCVVTGWGFTRSPDEAPGIRPNPSQILQQGIVPIMAYRECKDLEGYEQLLTPNMLCAGYKDGGVDACAFDSGGPLQCRYGDKWYAVGVTSWGDANGSGCARPLRPGVYTRVGNHVNWIQETIYADFAGLPQINWRRIIPNPMLPQK